MNYYEYLRSPEWQEKRKIALKRAGHRCVICASRHQLQVHHNSYERIGQEAPEDLTVLCDSCHELVSAKLPAWYWWLGRVASKIFDCIEG